MSFEFIHVHSQPAFRFEDMRIGKYRRIVIVDKMGERDSGLGLVLVVAEAISIVDSQAYPWRNAFATKNCALTRDDAMETCRCTH